MTDSGCQQCRENTYSGDGAESCTSCPDGKVSKSGSKSIMDCYYGACLCLFVRYYSTPKKQSITDNPKYCSITMAYGWFIGSTMVIDLEHSLNTKINGI